MLLVQLMPDNFPQFQKVKVLNSYCDCIVLRYHENDGAIRASHVSNVPIINAGSGSGQHPTQSLLDLFTIKDCLGTIKGLNIALCGDLKNGRTIHSLAYLLGKFNDNILYFVSPKNLTIPDNIRNYLTKHKITYVEVDNFQDIINEVDVLYQTRVQKERFDTTEEYEESKDKLILDRSLVNNMKMDSIILHPLPRVCEICHEVDNNYRAKYFEQAQNGLYVRMALLKYIME